jgi:hypothetical protein
MTTAFAFNAPPVVFDPTIIEDEVLAELRRESFTMMDAAPRFGAWLHRWTEHEQLIRAGEKPRQPDVHSRCLPPLPDWSDAEIGQALLVCAQFIYVAGDAALGAFADRLTLAICGDAGRRLIERKTNG